MPRSGRRLLLEAIGIGLVAQIATLLLLNRIASDRVAIAASSGVFFAALLTWSRTTSQRWRWARLLLRMVIFALLWVLIARVFGLFGW